MLRLAALLAIVGALTGCVSTGTVTVAPFNSLTSEELAGIQRVDSVVWMTQNAVQPAEPARPVSTQGSPPSAASIMNDTLNEFAYTFNSLWLKDRAAAVDAALQTFDFGSELLTIAKARLETVNKFPLTVRPVVVRNRAAGLAQLDGSTASAVLNVAVIYKLGERGDLRFTAWASMIPKTEALKKFRPKPNDANPVSFYNAIYLREFTFNTPSAANAADVRARFIEAANNLVSQVATDLNNSK